jgi:spore coat polysaccharide biosynthesis predicted glycosyltransferase SpsG/RimJ/RimL family protein N-acetyltransferase
VIDDMAHLPAYHADILLNQNLDTEKLKYNCDSDTALLLGPRYALLRQEFLAWRGWQREIPKAAHKVLVTMGGGDPDNVTGAVIRALSDLPGVEAVVVVGGSNPNLAALNAAIGDRPSTVRLVANATNMPELMAWADVAVAGAGTTSWELAFMGLPCLLMVLADNQRSVAQVLDRQGVSKSLGGGRQIDPAHLARALGALLLDAGQRGQMSRAGRTLVDGRGAGRVVTRLVARGLGLRRAKETDCRMIWTWANEPSVRQASFVSDPIPWDQHVRWFSAKMADGKCFYYVGSDDRDNPIGQIRFDLDGREGAVSLSLAPAMRGRGYGSALIVRGVEQFFADSQAEVVHAYIKPENQISLRAFERADFGFAAGTRIHGLEARHLILTRKPYGN